MEQESVHFIYWIILFVLFGLALFVIPRFLFRRAVSQVIRIFKRNYCVCPVRSQTLEELGLEPPGPIAKLFKPRDYKPFALQALVSVGIVRLSEDGRLCLVEEKVPQFLMTSGDA
jgi:hypothetical protein